MTVIAANRKGMAADTFVTGGPSPPYHTIKIFRIGDNIVGGAGTSAATTKWFEWMRRDCPPMDEIDLAGADGDTFIGLVLNEDGLFVYNAMCEPDKLLDEFYAIGSGSKYAQVELAQGRSPKAAVLRACEFDDGCRLFVPGEPTVLSMKPKTSKTKLKHQRPTPPEAAPAEPTEEKNADTKAV